MMIRSSWPYHDDGPPAPRPIYKVALLAVVLFAVAWVVVAVALLASLVLRLF